MNRVGGKSYPAARRTWRTLAIPLWRYAAPFLAALVLLDLIVFALVHGIWGACYGAFAWIGMC
ncbi:MAG: hypothetical protein NBV67_16350 [Tagaea sp.]|nr:hypothetical protein [Tagaea sp.]